MKPFFLLIILMINLAAGESAAFQLTNSARFEAALTRMLAVQPGPAAYPEQDFNWLYEVATFADRARHYDVAEAAMLVITERWPHLSQPWGNLSCYQGKQGKFAEALKSVEQAKARPQADRQQLDGISAVWLWHLGKQDEAQAMQAALPQPKAGDRDLPMWLVCQAFFHASCDRDQAATRQAIGRLLALPDVGHWRYFFARDVAFDAVRQEAWFIALLGQTATGTASGTPFSPVVPSAAVAAIQRMPPHPEEVLARAEIAAACRHLNNGAWQKAVESADRALQEAQLPEAYVTKALALAGLDQPKPAMDAIREISHQGFHLGAWPVDHFLLLPASRATVKRLVADAKAGKGPDRSVALAMIVNAHFAASWREHDEVIAAMDAAETWCPTLPEVQNTRAIARIDKQDWAGAEADLRTAIKLDPDFADAYLNRAYMRREQGQETEAMALFEEAKRHGATYPGTELHACLFLGAVGRFDEAMAIIAAAQAQPRPHRRLAGACWELSSYFSIPRRYADSERLTRMVIARLPEWHDAWTKLSGDLARQGKFAEAEECARKHLDGNPDAYDGQLALAAHLACLNRREEAAAIAAQVRPPDGARQLGHYHGEKALYAAAIGDEDGVRQGLTLAFQGPHRERMLRWCRCDILLDGYRAKPWFMALVPPQ